MAVETCSIEEIEGVLKEVAIEIGFPSLKSKQNEAIVTFVLGKDIFVSLPTSYGKSVIFAMLPLVSDKLLG